MTIQNPIRQTIARVLRNSREVARNRAPQADVTTRNKLARGMARHALCRVGIEYTALEPVEA
jgi:hypothetical protein